MAEFECGDGLLNVVLVRRTRNQHASLRVTSQRFLEDVGQLGITVGDVFVLLGVCERVDAVSEGGERLVDLLGLRTNGY